MYVAGKANSIGKGLTLLDLKLECEEHELSTRRKRSGDNAIERYFFIMFGNEGFSLEEPPAHFMTRVNLMYVYNYSA